MSELNVGKLVVSQGIVPPSVATQNRPTSPVVGSIIYNISSQIWEEWTGSSWIPVSGLNIIATGGTIRYTAGYKIHVFTGDGSFSVTTGSGEVEYLIAAAGGGGGAWVGGGGGAGGLLMGIASVTVGTYNVVVGAGGTAEYNPGSYGGMPRATNGGNSSVFGLTSIGGGRGGSWNAFPATSGGSGGGNGFSFAGAAGTSGQGNSGGQGRGSSVNGYPTGGGGGAGGPGGNWTAVQSGNGGPGLPSTITGTQTYYCGGGGGGLHGAATASNGVPGIGGLGGGGMGDGPTVNAGTANPNNTSLRFQNATFPTGESGFTNTGGGGGGSGSGGSAQSLGGTGGSGIVIIRYRIF